MAPCFPFPIAFVSKLVDLRTSFQEEAVPESLKNILLVMSNGSFLVPPAAGEKGSEIWEETWKRVDRFLPGLRKEIFPNLAPESKGEHQPSQPVQPMLEKEPREKPAAAAQ